MEINVTCIEISFSDLLQASPFPQLFVWMGLQRRICTSTISVQNALAMRAESIPKAQGVSHTKSKLFSPIDCPIYLWQVFLVKAGGTCAGAGTKPPSLTSPLAWGSQAHNCGFIHCYVNLADFLPNSTL